MLRARALNSAPKSTARRRKPVYGATRKAPVENKQSRSFAWLNRLIILLGVGVVIAAVAKAAIVLRAIPVERIAVTGKIEHTQTLALQEMVQPALVGGFLSADLQRIRKQLESLPWVYEATVKRRWPSTLEIHVVEQLPIARWGEYGFLNHEGEVFHSTAANDRASLPLLTGPAGSEQKLIANYQLLTEKLLPIGLAVAALAIDDRGQMRATLAGDIEVIFGEHGLVERLDRFVALFDASLLRRIDEIERVDLRYESGIAVAFAGPSEVAGL